METIRVGNVGAAVEDIQDRLSSIGYQVDEAERSEGSYGRSTATAVARFRLDHGLSLGEDVDAATWAALVDECYQLGDRTLYLRLPNFHGNDVRQLQERLNVLGFSCGPVDGSYGVHTEAAVKLFQESIGALADGMAFPDTFDAIERLRHVWAGKPADGPHPQGSMGFARAASVLEDAGIAITAEDPISRNVAGRIWNLAHATVEDCALNLVGSPETADEGTRVLIILSTEPLPENVATGVGNIMLDDIETLPRRMRSAIQSSDTTPRAVRIELPVGAAAFTVSDAQTFAVLLLDAICSAFDRLEIA